METYSPVGNENRVLDQEEYSRYKRIRAVLVILFLCIDTLLFVCQLYTCSICILIGIVLPAGLQFSCIYKKILKKNIRMIK